MERTFCFEENQVDRLVQLVKHELVNLDVLIGVAHVSDSVRMQLKVEKVLCGSILDVLLGRG